MKTKRGNINFGVLAPLMMLGILWVWRTQCSVSPVDVMACIDAKREREGLPPLWWFYNESCAGRIPPHDGQGSRQRLPQALLIGAFKGGTGEDNLS